MHAIKIYMRHNEPEGPGKLMCFSPQPSKAELDGQEFSICSAQVSVDVSEATFVTVKIPVSSIEIVSE